MNTDNTGELAAKKKTKALSDVSLPSGTYSEVDNLEAAYNDWAAAAKGAQRTIDRLREATEKWKKRTYEQINKVAELQAEVARLTAQLTDRKNKN